MVAVRTVGAGAGLGGGNQVLAVLDAGGAGAPVAELADTVHVRRGRRVGEDRGGQLALALATCPPKIIGGVARSEVRCSRGHEQEREDDSGHLVNVECGYATT